MSSHVQTNFQYFVCSMVGNFLQCSEKFCSNGGYFAYFATENFLPYSNRFPSNGEYFVCSIIGNFLWCSERLSLNKEYFVYLKAEKFLDSLSRYSHETLYNRIYVILRCFKSENNTVALENNYSLGISEKETAKRIRTQCRWFAQRELKVEEQLRATHCRIVWNFSSNCSEREREKVKESRVKNPENWLLLDTGRFSRRKLRFHG